MCHERSLKKPLLRSHDEVIKESEGVENDPLPPKLLN